MTKNLLYLGAAFVLLIASAGKAQSLDFNSLADQSTFRCSGGVVALGDSHRSVREKCGEPMEITQIYSVKLKKGKSKDTKLEKEKEELSKSIEV